jgi:hypothetical protein
VHTRTRLGLPNRVVLSDDPSYARQGGCGGASERWTQRENFQPPANPSVPLEKRETDRHAQLALSPDPACPCPAQTADPCPRKSAATPASASCQRTCRRDAKASDGRTMHLMGGGGVDGGRSASWRVKPTMIVRFSVQLALLPFPRGSETTKHFAPDPSLVGSPPISRSAMTLRDDRLFSPLLTQDRLMRRFHHERWRCAESICLFASS